METLIEYGKLAMFVAFVLLTLVIVVLINNIGVRKQCRSLNEQGVKAYVADGIVEQKCVVIERFIGSQK